MSTAQQRLKDLFSRVGNTRGVLRSDKVTKTIRMSIAAVVLLFAWHSVSILFFNPTTFPSPIVVGEQLLVIFENGGPRRRSALFHLRESLVRVIITMVLAMSFAMAIGIAMGLNDAFEAPMSRWLPFWMTAPTVVVILITMVMFNFSETAVIVSVVFAATPYAAIPIWKAMEQIDPDLLTMADGFSLSGTSRLRNIYIPSIMPSVFASLRYLVGTTWKVVVLAEVFGRSEGLGAMFRFYYQQADVATLLAYMVLFLVVMFLIEYAVVDPTEKHVFRWRD